MTIYNRTGLRDIRTASLLSRRCFVQGSGLMAAGGMLAGCGTKAARSLSDVTLSFTVMKEGVQNFFSDAGQDRTPYKTNYPLLPFDLALQAIDNASADGGYYFSDIPLGVWGGALKNCRVIGILLADTPGKMLGLVAKPGVPYRSPADLRGRRIGYMRSSNYQFYLLKLLEEAGLGWNDIEPINLNRDAMPPAFASGQLDFWITQGLDTIIAQRHFGGRLVAQPHDAYTGNGVIVANIKTLEDPLKSQALGDYILRLRKVYEWIAANRATYTKKLSRITGLDYDMLNELHTQRRVPIRVVPISDEVIAQQRGAIDLFVRFGQAKPSDISGPGLWDRRYTSLLQG